jgi:hypothetical protein
VARPVTVSGTLTLPHIPDGLPEQGALRGQLALAGIPDPLQITLDWQQQSGTLSAIAEQQSTPLLTLPWHISSQQIDITQGQWSWPYAGQPLSGGIALSAKNWQQGLPASEISGRLNLLTQGRGGKGNVVLTLGPGHLDWSDSQLPFRLTGESKLASLQFFAGLPGELRGPLLDPQLHQPELMADCRRSSAPTTPKWAVSACIWMAVQPTSGPIKGSGCGATGATAIWLRWRRSGI